MLGKLLKHDLRSTARLILPATLLMLGICILGSVALRIAISNAEAMVSKGNVATLLIFLAFIMMYMISMLALIVYSSASIFLVIIHYYKNLFTDEGYLTFTLPVST